MKFFEVKVRYQRVVENLNKVVTETYAIAAQTFSDAKHKALEVEGATDVFNRMPGNAACRELTSVKETNILEVFQ